MPPRFKSAFAWVLVSLAPSTASADDRHKVVWQSVHENGLVANYLRPKGEAVRPALIVLGGSQGGFPDQLAYKFAEQGWATLSVAYFGAKDLPPALANIPVEYLDGAVSWLQRQPLTDTKALALVSVSRGSELALLFASQRTVVRRVVAYVPSHVVWGPVGVFADKTVSAWTLADKPLPYVRHAREPDYSARPYHGTPDFLRDLGQATAAQAAAIPVEKINGPILLLSGEDDQVWPSTFMARQIMKRLDAARFPFRHEHVSFPNAGHLITPDSDPGVREARHPTGIVIAFGGTKPGNREAKERAWAKVLEFLRAE